VRNSTGDMVPLGAVLTIREVGGPDPADALHMYPAAAVVGQHAERHQLRRRHHDDGKTWHHDQLPPSFGYEWTEIQLHPDRRLQEHLEQSYFPARRGVVFLVLAAQYESWRCRWPSSSSCRCASSARSPACISAVRTSTSSRRSASSYWSAWRGKNAILIVEFAKHKHEEGLSRLDATLAACKLRLRPILMTSFAFILGVVPLMLANGAGSEMRRTLGTAVSAACWA